MEDGSRVGMLVLTGRNERDEVLVDEEVAECVDLEGLGEGREVDFCE